MNPNPTVSHLMTVFSSTINGCDLEVWEEQLSAAIDAIFYRVTPIIFAIETSTNEHLTLDILSGQKILHAMNKFMNENVPYPLTGKLEDFRGKTFSELPHNMKTTLRETQIKMTVLSLFSENKGKEEAFRATVKAMTGLV
jgi:hypothetical protein